MEVPKPIVLVVDDNEEKRYAIVRYLRAAGFEIWETPSGEEGLRLALNQPSVIALDVKLPDMLGYEVSRRLREDPRTAGIPIIQISATFTTSTSVAKGLNSGADAYLTGPVEPEELIATVNAVIRMRRAETGAKDLAAKWQATFDAISDAILLVNHDGTVERCNRAFCALVRKNAEEVVGRGLSEVASSGTLDQSVYFQMFGSRQRESVERCVHGKWFGITADPVLDGEGSFRGGVLIISDLTEAKRAEEASRQLAAIVSSSDDAIVSKTLNGVITSWNQGAERLFGYTAEEIVGQPVSILIPSEYLDEETDILAHIRRGERKDHFQTVRRRKDGSLVDVSLTVSPVRDAEGQVVGASKIARDISKQKEAARLLEEAHQEVLAASLAKDNFLAALSHELRTPLNPVLLLASEAAEDPSLPDRVRLQFESIRNNVELEARLIDDLLDITRISHGKLLLDVKPVDLHLILWDAVATVRAELNQKKIRLNVVLTVDDATSRGDAVRLQQVFWNVLKNAIKFTPEGGEIDIHSSLPHQSSILFIVTDTGIGMTPGEVARVFEAFTQGDDVGLRNPHRFGGLGLGLSICKKLLELHSGSIRASSPGPGLGSTFYITLPLTALGPAELPPAPVPGPSTSEGAGKPVPPLRILLVEDHEPTRKTLSSILTRRGHSVACASSVAQARKMFDEHPFQLLISDLGLPDGNGCELMQALLRKNKDLRGIALTGYGMEQDEEKCRAAGFGIHLTKPIRIQTLEAVLGALDWPGDAT